MPNAVDHQFVIDQEIDDIAYAKQQYQDVLELLAARGYDASLTETGGGCLGIEILRSNGQQVLITSNQGPLAYERDELSGWGIGVYDADNPSVQISYDETNDKSPSGIVAVLDGIR